MKAYDVVVYVQDIDDVKDGELNFVVPSNWHPQVADGMLYIEQVNGELSFVAMKYVTQIDVGLPREIEGSEFYSDN